MARSNITMSTPRTRRMLDCNVFKMPLAPARLEFAELEV
jgi:hypothetical protein